MEKLNLIFDFDGVIGDSLPVLIRIANEEFGKYLHEPLSVETVRTKGIKMFMQEYRMSGFRLFMWIWKARRLLAQASISSNQGIGELIRLLSDRGFSLQLVSSGGRPYVMRVLNDEGCVSAFETIQTNIGMFNKAKYIKSTAQAYLGGSVYIGDEVRDIEAAHKAGVKCISVTWGYESRAILQEANPDYLVDTPEELLHTIDVLALNRA